MCNFTPPNACYLDSNDSWPTLESKRQCVKLCAKLVWPSHLELTEIHIFFSEQVKSIFIHQLYLMLKMKKCWKQPKKFSI